MTNLYVIKVGGSLLSTSEDTLFDFDQAAKLKILISSFVDGGKKFILISGGGYLARKYQKLLKDNNFSPYDEHYVGTAACNLNATVLRSIFGNMAEEQIVSFNDFEKLDQIRFDKPVLIAGAAKPGPSSDWDAALMANHFSAECVISMKNINGVYSEDPRKNPLATRFDRINWEEYINLVGNKEWHTPGDSLPVDPIASRFSKERGIKFYILNGYDRVSLRNAIEGKLFEGTIIS